MSALSPVLTVNTVATLKASTEGFITTLNTTDFFQIGSVGNVAPPDMHGALVLSQLLVALERMHLGGYDCANIRDPI
jgi:hypothetical protein